MVERRACRFILLFVLAWALSQATVASAHPMVENALDVVIAPDRVELTVMVSVEEVRLTEPPDGAKTQEELSHSAVVGHGEYLLKHLHEY